jgi:hypothetical protein
LIEHVKLTAAKVRNVPEITKKNPKIFLFFLGSGDTGLVAGFLSVNFFSWICFFLTPLGVGSSLRRIKGKAPALRFCLNCDLFDFYDGWRVP